MIRLCIFGSRDAFPRFPDIRDGLDSLDLRIDQVDEIVCGYAPGADEMGRRYAEFREIAVRGFEADWKRHGKAAGPIRNRAMAEYATHGLGFWRGESRGTANMATQLLVLRKPVHVVRWEP